RVFDHLCEAEILAERIGDQRRLGWISAFIAGHFWWSSDLDRAVRAGHRALALAHAHGDFPLQVVANQRLGQAYLDLGDYRRASECFRSNIESLQGELIRGRFGEVGLPSVGSRLFLADVLTELGEFAQGVSMGDRSGYARRAAYLSEAYCLAKRADDAVRLGGQALEFARDHKRRREQPWALQALGEIASHRDPPAAEEAEAFYRQA